MIEPQEELKRLENCLKELDDMDPVMVRRVLQWLCERLVPDHHVYFLINKK